MREFDEMLSARIFYLTQQAAATIITEDIACLNWHSVNDQTNQIAIIY